VEDFCTSAGNVRPVARPVDSIGEQAVVNGTLRWKLNEQTCFDYWGKIGTDCNICMRVCPEPCQTFPHRLIVEMVSRNQSARRVFNLMDDAFYGRNQSQRSSSLAKFV